MDTNLETIAPARLRLSHYTAYDPIAENWSTPINLAALQELAMREPDASAALCTPGGLPLSDPFPALAICQRARLEEPKPEPAPEPAPTPAPATQEPPATSTALDPETLELFQTAARCIVSCCTTGILLLYACVGGMFGVMFAGVSGGGIGAVIGLALAVSERRRMTAKPKQKDKPEKGK